MTISMEQVGVVLVDDDPFARLGLRAAIEEESDLRVTGEAAEWEDALALAGNRDVQVIVMRAKPGDPGCLELLHELDRHAPQVTVLALGTRNPAGDALSLVQAGVAAYLDLDTSPQELAGAVRTVAKGGRALDPHVLSGVVHDYLARRPHRPATSHASLTRREREVLTLVAEGLSTREIATDLHLSHKTVEVHRQRIMDKLDRHKVADLVRYALREGLVSIDAG